jgi:hypothetical protein
MNTYYIPYSFDLILNDNFLILFSDAIDTESWKWVTYKPKNLKRWDESYEFVSM